MPTRSRAFAPAVGFAAPVVPLLREAVDAGVLWVDPADRYWFAHPLLAEILDADLLVEERRALHASFAAALDTGGELDADAVVDLADHYERAGMAEPAYRWALRAADVSAGAAEKLRLLRRALKLEESLADSGVSRVDLWHRIRAAAQQAAREFDELEAIEALLTMVDPDRDLLARARLYLRRSDLRDSMGFEVACLADRRAAVALTAAHSRSVEHAVASAGLADALLGRGDDAGVDLAHRSFLLARECGSDEAVGNALISCAYARLYREDPRAHQDAQQAWTIGARLRDFAILMGAVYAAVNSYDGDSERGIADLFHRAVENLAELDAPHKQIAEMCAWEASCMLEVGDWRTCLSRLRVALGARPGARGDALARLVGARLACWQGRQAEAEAHLARAEEIFPGHATNPGCDFDAVRALVALTAADTDRTLAIAIAGLDGKPAADRSQYMLPIATRALADQAETLRDSGEDPAPVLARLDELRRRHPVVLVDPQGPPSLDRRRVRALQNMTDAETARATHSAEELPAWRRAGDACHDAAAPWDETYSRWRQAQAALRDRATHREAVAPLRRAYHLATELQALPLLGEVERLAQGARISLNAGPDTAPDPSQLPRLTGREREILGYVIVGHTNAEIAKVLVVSEKTVSVHISNMLRKTGATNRIQLTELVHRLQARRPDQVAGN